MILSSMAMLANFTVPSEIGNGPGSLLWILPLLVAVAVVWKILKLPVVTASKFVWEVAVLFGTLLVCYGAIAVALYIIGRLIIG